MYLQVLAEARRIVISQGFGVTEGLEQGVGGQHHVLDLLNLAALAAGDVGDVLHYPLGSLGLAGTGFTRDDNTLVVPICLHVIVSRLGDGENVRGHLEAVLALVGLEDLVGVDAEVAKGVDGDQDMADVGVYLAALEALL